MGQEFRWDVAEKRHVPIKQRRPLINAQFSWAEVAQNAIILLLTSFFACLFVYSVYSFAQNRFRPPIQVPVLVSSSSNLVEPVYKGIRFGAYAGEAASMAGIKLQSTLYFSEPERYIQYRQAVRSVYGADLEDMNYLGIGLDQDIARINKMGHWLLMAGQYGDVTIALEPLGEQKMGVFSDNEEMKALKNVFEQAKRQKITVWVRFASEANLSNSKYSAYHRDADAVDFYDRAVWFKNYMPDNVKLVFSPLINTAVAGQARQTKIIGLKFNGGQNSPQTLPWDRIGGTLYRTDVALAPTYEKYYTMMSQMADHLDFQLCELGGPYNRKDETLEFIETCTQGKWPRLVHINLFARDINKRADPNAEFGFVDPIKRAEAIQIAEETGHPTLVDSFIKPLLSKH